MGRSRLSLRGFGEFRGNLGTFPTGIRTEAAHVLEGEANAAAVNIRRAYASHVDSGALLRGLTVINQSTDQRVRVRIRSASPIAWLFDHGSQIRHWKTKSRKSTGRMWTATPPTFIFTRSVIEARREAFRQIADRLTQYGLLVTGA